MNQRGINKDLVYYLIKFEDPKRNPNESISYFIKRFNNIYNKMPADCKHLDIVAKLIFSKAFNDYFALMLRERKSKTLEDMEIDAINVEANKAASGKLREKAKKQKN